MGSIIRFPARGHVRASFSKGYKSGRNSDRGTPDTFSTVKTRRGGTSSHCETACAVTPIKRAKLAWPPELLIARLRADALSLMGRHSSMALPRSQALLHCVDKAGLYDIEMTLGKRIKAAREQLKPKMTQAGLAANFGISDKAVSGWERGDTSPDLEKIAKLARVLKVPSIWLLEGKGPPPPPDSIESGLERLDQPSRDLVAAMIQTLLKQRDTAA